MMDTAEGERLRRWRLVLGEEAQASCGLAGLSPGDRQMDEALAALYEADSRHSLRGGKPRRRAWPAGSGTSGVFSRLQWCKSCKRTPSSASTCTVCCSSRKCSKACSPT
ncbi:hypothetical protein [Bilophila wadsworthia]|uniref:hypothetical protein n=1 Tax=Bilophila wadsworthia TaxID=35833 RepID=UPI00242B9277|nr:hypothetical protein [Bilophila wadsworthia]